MAHEFESGFFVRESAWHGLGRVLDDAPTSGAEAARLAGLDWTVSLRELFDASGKAARKVRSIVRDSDGRELGYCGPRTTILQNAAAFGLMDPIVAAGEGTYEAAMSLRHGERVVVLVKLGHNGDSHADIVPGDTIVNHLFVANAHDGKASVVFGRSRTRIVCMNTLQSAQGEGTNARVRHTASMVSTLEEIRDIVRVEHEVFNKDMNAFRALAKTPITKARLREYVKAVFPQSFKKPEDFKRSKTVGGKVWRAEDSAKQTGPTYVPPASGSILDDLLGSSAPPTTMHSSEIEAASDEFVSPIFDRMVELVETGRGADLPGVRGTMWGAYNAAVEHMQYEHGRGPVGFNDKRADSMLFGAGATANALALSKALEFAQYGKGA